MTNRINDLLDRKRKDILSVYYTAGFPALQSTVSIARHLEEGGADLIEIGIPFSDPVADGPVIQGSNKMALDNGMSVKLLLNQVAEIRKSVTLPIILMGYLNPVMQFGAEKFCASAAAAGVDGLILPDMPMEVYESEYQSLFNAHRLRNAFLISPTTSEERIKKIDKATSGFIYAVSASSTTGAKDGFTADQEAYFKRLKEMKLNNPFLIGFGISTHATFSTVCNYAAGAIVGSAFVSLLREKGDLKDGISRFIADLRGSQK